MPLSTVLWNSPHFKENNHHYSLVQCREEFNQRSSFVTQPRKDNTKHYGKHDQTNDVHSSRGRHSCRYSARTCLDLSSYGGNVYGTIVMDADNFLASLEVNIIARDIVSLWSCGYCNVVCFFLFTRKKDTECLLIIALEKIYPKTRSHKGFLDILVWPLKSEVIFPRYSYGVRGKRPVII